MRLPFILAAALCLPLLAHAQDYAERPRAADEAFDRVRDSGHICYDTGASRLLSTDEQPEAAQCRSAYAGCEGEDCLIVVHGAVKRLDKAFLLRAGDDIRRALAARRATGPQAAFPGTLPWIPPGFADPVCSWYHQLGFPCPEGAGLPGGGSQPSGGVPGTPGPDDNCWICTAEYLLCFASAGVNLVQQFFCEQDLEACAAKRCG